jgi:hypothetical protein
MILHLDKRRPWTVPDSLIIFPTPWNLQKAFNMAKYGKIEFLRLYMEPNPKIFALCMGLHRRLGLDSPLRMLNVDIVLEIAKHVYRT